MGRFLWLKLLLSKTANFFFKAIKYCVTYVTKNNIFLISVSSKIIYLVE